MCLGGTGVEYTGQEISQEWYAPSTAAPFFLLNIITLLSACRGICFAFHTPPIELNKSTVFVYLFVSSHYFYRLCSFFKIFFFISPCCFLPPAVLLYLSPSSSPPLLYPIPVLKATHLMLLCYIISQCGCKALSKSVIFHIAASVSIDPVSCALFCIFSGLGELNPWRWKRPKWGMGGRGVGPFLKSPPDLPASSPKIFPQLPFL